MLEERENLKKESLVKRNYSMKILKIFSLSILQKARGTLERAPSVAGEPVAKMIRHVTCRSSQPSQQKHCQLGMNRAEAGKRKEGRLGFWGSPARKQASKAIWL